MARRKNTAEAFEILYRRSKKRTSGRAPGENRGSTGEPDSTVTKGELEPKGQTDAEHVDESSPRGERSGAPLGRPRSLRRPIRSAA